jgi:hypothetical protein
MGRLGDRPSWRNESSSLSGQNMTVKGIHPVSSKEHMLEPNDIFIVAAHEYKEGLKQFQAAAKKHGISAERLQYSVMIKMYSDPRLVRLRSGNTLFTIASFPDRVGFIHMYNGDTAANLVHNIAESLVAAERMGYEHIVATVTPEVVKATKMALKTIPDEGFSLQFDSAAKILYISTKKGE